MFLKKDLAVLVLIFFLLSLFGCSKKSSEPDISSPVKNNLIFKRSDGTQVQFKPNTFVWCGPWEEDKIPVETFHIWVGFDPAVQEQKTGWMLQAVISDVNIGEELEFPNTFSWNHPDGVLLFVLDDPNELSTQEEDSRGGIVFQKLSCDTEGEVQFSIDAVIGSEFSGTGDSLKVSGTFYAPITGPPVLKKK
ncbi:MAG: hypothetical protein AMJ90_00535 [candidate division Zixibacteria bacterium SM23_73_2]|nr:MAG: hypothetical protein AMJ90_00535 [candidate division Zixibacteria bacterium SM23_73_2]